MGDWDYECKSINGYFLLGYSAKRREPRQPFYGPSGSIMDTGPGHSSKKRVLVYRAAIGNGSVSGAGLVNH
jgi:hypothetical protein